MSGKKSYGWEQLICSFFYAVCVRVLGDYFTPLGFIPHKTKIGGVLFKSKDIYIEVSYVPETAPNYSPSLVIGVGDKKYDDLGNPTGLPAWSVVPGDSDIRSFSLWTFTNEAELDSLLYKLKTKIIVPYLKPYWENQAQLKEQIKTFIGP